MNENIKSIRIEYKDFVCDDRFREGTYFQALQEPLNKKSVFLLADKTTRCGSFADTMRRLIAKGFTVYALPVIEKKIEGVTPVKEKSDEYYRALATSKYIYAAAWLPSVFVPRDGQTVINAVEDAVLTLEDRINRDKTDCRSTLNAKTKNHPRGLTQKRLLKTIRFPFLLRFIGKRRQNAKQLLFVANIKYNDNALELFKRMAAPLLGDSCTLTLLIDHTAVREHEAELAALDSRIRILTKDGRFLRSERDNDKIEFLNKEFFYLENPQDVRGFLPDYLFDYERRRLFGDRRFDRAVNLMYHHFYWIWLAKTSAAEYVHIDNANLSGYTDINRASRAGVLSLFDEVYFTNKDFYDTATDACPALLKNASVLPYKPTADPHEQVLKTADIGGQKRLILHMKNRDIFSAKVISTVPYFDAGGADYAIINTAMTADENADILKQVSPEKLLFLIDPFEVMANAGSLLYRDNIGYITSLNDFSALIKRFDRCCLIGDCPAAEAEAKQLGKETVRL